MGGGGGSLCWCILYAEFITYVYGTLGKASWLFCLIFGGLSLSSKERRQTDRQIEGGTGETFLRNDLLR